MPDYATLKLIWWLLVGLLLIGFAIMDGHDMGVGTLLPFVGRSDEERRTVINTVGPHWDGNQVWFITGGGALFAAWPLVYATAFSGFYGVMLAVLWALFLRPVGFDFRSKLHHPAWRSSWDWALFVGGAVPPLVFGVAFGNLLQGVPFRLDDHLVSTYAGHAWQLLNPFALLCGVVSSAMITMHGATYLTHRTEGVIQQRASRAAGWAAAVTVLAFAAAGAWLRWGGIDGFVVVSGLDPNGLADPLAKTVVRRADGWWLNYGRYPLTIWLPLLGLGAAIVAAGLVRVGTGGGTGGGSGDVVRGGVRQTRTLLAFVASALSLVGIIGTAGAAMFPFVLPSSLAPSASLTAYDAVSSPLTLAVMLVATLLLLPLVVMYTGWAYRVMRGKVTVEHIRANEHGVY
jgi:cytochrome bd ubiquinol oxidase subunit II